MNKKLTFIFLSLIMIACSNDEPVVIQNEVDSNVTESQYLSEISKEIATSEISLADIKYIANGVSLAVNNGLDEIFYFKELLNHDSKIVSNKEQRKNLEITKLFSSPVITNFYKINANSDKLMIYWPFHENWDGVSKPVISFTPENPLQQSNIGYFLDSGELKTIEVDLNYVKNNPVWIICLSPIEYNQLPDFNNPEFINCNGELNIIPRKPDTTFSPNNGVSAMKIRSEQTCGIFISKFTIKPYRFMTFVGNSITYYFYGKCTSNGEECNDIISDTFAMVITAAEYNYGVTKNELDIVHLIEGYLYNDYDLEFCIATTTDAGEAPEIIRPYSIDIPNDQTIKVSRNYENVLNTYFPTNLSFTDSTTNLKNNLIWEFYLNTQSDI